MSDMPFPNRKYNIILADTPWHYRDRRNNHTRFCGGAIGHYPLMKTEEICNLDVGSITAENSALFLWATFPNLEESLKVMKAWGFEYKTLGFSWIKTNKKNGKPFFGIGYYTKSNCEVCLLGIKGKLKPISNKVSSVIISPRKEHSKKPIEVRERIVELFGDLPRIELFARESAEGWDSWGNEIEGESVKQTKKNDLLTGLTDA